VDTKILAHEAMNLRRFSNLFIQEFFYNSRKENPIDGRALQKEWREAITKEQTNDPIGLSV